MCQSILASIKNQVGDSADNHCFDDDLLLYTNSALNRAVQLGHGTKGFRVIGFEDTWDQFISPESTYYDMVLEYVALRVKVVFDPSASSSIQKFYSERIQELEWLLEAGGTADRGEVV